MKLPNFRRSGPPPKTKRSLQANAARMKPGYDAYEEDGEPTTRLSSAFIVVLVIHLVFVGGIYAFNGIKAHRRSQEVLNAPVTATTAVPKPVAKPDTSADAKYAAIATPVPAVRPPAAAAPPVSAARIYRVRAGDTLAKVAAASSVNLTDLASLNSLKESSILHAGQNLFLPAKRTTTAAAAPANDVKKQAFLNARDGVSTATTYTVRSGDTSVGIARKFGVSQEELMKLNKIEDPKKLQINQVLKVPAKAKAVAENAG